MFERVRLQMVMRRKMRVETSDNKAAIAATLADDDKFDDLLESLKSEHRAYLNGLSGTPEGKLTDFLDWVVAHWDFIMKIIALFMSKAAGVQ